MGNLLRAVLFLFLGVELTGHPHGYAVGLQATQTTQQAFTELSDILTNLQRLARSASEHIAELKIDKWNTGPSVKQQMQQVADSLQHRFASQIPALIDEVERSHSKVKASSKLYSDTAVTEEMLTQLAKAAGSFGKPKEYLPLTNNAQNLTQLRETLSGYIARYSKQHKKTPGSGPQSGDANHPGSHKKS